MTRRPPPTRGLLLTATTLLLLSATPTSAIDATGATAVVSLAKSSEYAAGRACAVGCLVYNGVFQCGVNAGYQDLGVGLGCGCGPNNACYCGAKMSSSAASYITSCVSERCGRSVAGWKGEASSVQGLYDGYCRSALGDAAAAVATTTTGAGGAGATAKGDGPPTPTGRGTGTAQQGETKGGLSQSDIIALAASLGVGVPSLLVATATLWVQMRKKKKKKEEAASAVAAAAGTAPVVGQPEAAAAVHKPVESWTPSPSPHVSEAP